MGFILSVLALAQLGRKTLCLDCDVGLRNLDIAMAMTDRAMMDFTDVLAGSCTLEEAAVPHPGQKDLYLLTAPTRIGAADVEAGALEKLLPAIRERFDYCLIDAPAGLGAGFQLAVGGADRAVVVSTTDESSLRDAQRTVMELSRFPNGHVHLVVNRCRKKLMKSLHLTVDDAMPLYAGRGIALLLSDNDCAARAYRNIARRLEGRRTPMMKIR